MATGIVSHFVGEIKPFAGSTPPDGWLLCDGAAYARGTGEADPYWDLWQVLSNGGGVGGTSPWGNGDGATTFNVPDLGGLTLVGTGTAGEVGTTGGAEVVTLTSAHVPAHTHTVASVSTAGAHTHTGSTSLDSVTHNHLAGFTYGLIGEVAANPVTGTFLAEANYGYASSSGNSSIESATHAHSFTTTTSVDHAHIVSTANAQTSGNNWAGGSHNNMPPYLVVNYIIKY